MRLGRGSAIPPSVLPARQGVRLVSFVLVLAVSVVFAASFPVPATSATSATKTTRRTATTATTKRQSARTTRPTSLRAERPVPLARPSLLREGVRVAAPVPGPDATVVPPDRFYAQLFTEGLGRVPTQAEWAQYQGALPGRRCDADLLGALAEPVLAGTELTGLRYTVHERVLVTVRALLARDPTTAELGEIVRSLGPVSGSGSGSVSEAAWRSLVRTVVASDDFSAITTRLCDETVSDPGWGGAEPPSLPPGDGFQGSQAALQRALDALARRGGGVLALAPRALVRVTNPPLVVPPGVTVTTAGAPEPSSYARMARLVRAQILGDDLDDQAVRPVVQLRGGAALRNVWVDGQRARAGRRFASFNVMVDPGSGTTLEANRLDNTAGATNVQSNGSAPWGTCRSNRFVGNFVQAYASNHVPLPAPGARGGWRGWADGFSVHCEDALVARNTIVDATDVGIITFADTAVRAGAVDGSAVQRSVVRDNVVVNVGSSSFAALAADAFMPTAAVVDRPAESPDPPGVASRSFVGNRFSGNLVWTGDRAHLHIVLSVGTGAWFGPQGLNGRGAEFSGNSSGTGRVRALVGVVVANMLDAVVTGNSLSLLLPTVTRSGGCPAVAAAVEEGSTGTRVDDTFAVARFEELRACLDHPGG